MTTQIFIASKQGKKKRTWKRISQLRKKDTTLIKLMYSSVNYSKKTLKVITLSESISQLKKSVFFYDVLAEYVFCRKPSHFSWFGFEPASVVSTAMRQNLAHSLENSEQKPSPSLGIGMQDHTVRSQSHTRLNLHTCSRKDLLYGQNILTINWILLTSAFLAELFPWRIQGDWGSCKHVILTSHWTSARWEHLRLEKWCLYAVFRSHSWSSGYFAKD